VTALELLKSWRVVPALVEQIARDVGDVVAHQVAHAALYRQRPPRRHFVALFGYGHDNGVGTPTRMLVGGACCELVEGEPGGPVLSFMPGAPWHAVTLVVCCDLSHVQVDGLFVGNDLVPLNVASGCPIGFALKVETGQRIAATVRLRGQP